MKRATMLVVILALATFVSAQDKAPAGTSGSGTSRSRATTGGETTTPGQDAGRI